MQARVLLTGKVEKLTLRGGSKLARTCLFNSMNPFVRDIILGHVHEDSFSDCL